MAKPCNKFTQEQMEDLRSSKYIRNVGEDMVFYTDECKQLCRQMYTIEKLMPKEIMQRLGLNYQTLGKTRVRGLMHHLKKKYERGEEVSGTQGAEQPKRREKQAPELKLERLHIENEYLKQELEFIKKIIAADKEGK